MVKNINILWLFIGLFCCSYAIAQENTTVDTFVKKYGSGNTRTPHPQIGQKIPNYFFDKDLNSTALNGKVVVLDFWATWCVGCLVVSHGMDSLMLKETDVYKDKVQIIGVNLKETKTKEGESRGRLYWAKAHKSFPMVDGTGADAIGAAVENGFPTVMLIDQEGIVRGRWDGAGRTTANEIMLQAWQYGVYPTIKKNTASWRLAQKAMAERDWITALYYYDQLPEQADSTALLRFQALLHVSEGQASNYMQSALQKLKGTPDELALKLELLRLVAESPTIHKGIVQQSSDLVEELFGRNANNYKIWSYKAAIHYKKSKIEEHQALMMANMAIKAAYGQPEEEIERLQKIKDSYGQLEWE